MKQKEAVYQAVTNVFAENAISWEDKQATPALKLLNADLTATIVGIVTLGIMSKEVDFSDEAQTKYDSEEKVKGYVKGMVNNHLRKDLRLNGNVDYVAKNPGSRASSGDEGLRETKKLLAKAQQAKNEPLIAACEAEIATRTAALAADKAKKLAIDVSKLPESLRAFATT